MLNTDEVKRRISNVEYTKIGKKTTVCCITLDNGFEVIASSSCVNPDEYNHKVGKRCSYNKCIEKVFELYAFLVTENLNSIKLEFTDKSRLINEYFTLV